MVRTDKRFHLEEKRMNTKEEVLNDIAEAERLPLLFFALFLTVESFHHLR